MAVGYRTSAEPSVIRRVAEMWPEGVEQMPYATSWKPLYPFPGSPITGGAGGSGSGAAAAQTPSTCDLSFVRGDSVVFSFFFPGVCWTPTLPAGTLPVAWEEHVWNAQIRDPDHHPADPCTYYCGGWIPIWGGLPTNEQRKTYAEMTFVTEFVVEAEFVTNSTDAPEGYATYGTMVTLSLDNTIENSGSLIYPDDGYMWDLQRGDEYVLDPDTDEIVDVVGPVTMLQGAVTVLIDYTYDERVVNA